MNKDLSLTFGGDFAVSQKGDLLLTNDTEQTKQRIIRRMLTVPGAYIWHTNYGAGLQRYIGQVLTNAKLQEIKALITEQIFLEDAVAKSPQPDITFEIIPTGLFCQINYTDAPTQSLETLSFTVSRP